jgi:hypothetical protein
MNTITTKRTYYTPQIERIELDNEISLILQSVVPEPGEPGVITLDGFEHFNNDPFKTNFS